MATHKDLGAQAFKEKNLDKAIGHFTDGINENPNDHTLYSNRSASYLG